MVRTYRRPASQIPSPALRVHEHQMRVGISNKVLVYHSIDFMNVNALTPNVDSLNKLPSLR